MPVLHKALTVGCKLSMTHYELTNFERKYFGLLEVNDTWERKFLSDEVIVYFDQDKIVKVLNYGHGYVEYDSDILTINREIILPRTSKGQEKKLTVARLLKIKPYGIEFSGSILGGGINVFDRRRNVSFIKSYLEEGRISNHDDIGTWIKKYISESPVDYFEWLSNQLNSEKNKIKAKKGDIIAFHVSRFEYAFASIISGDYLTEHLLLNGEVLKSNMFGEPLLILPYSEISSSTEIDFDKLLKSTTLPPLEIRCHNVSNGEFPIVGFRKLPESIMSNIDLSALNKYFTIPLSRTDIIRKSHQF